MLVNTEIPNIWLFAMFLLVFRIFTQSRRQHVSFQEFHEISCFRNIEHVFYQKLAYNYQTKPSFTLQPAESRANGVAPSLPLPPRT